MSHSARSAFLYGLVAYTVWGLLPIYWKRFGHVDPWETLAHRVVWSFLCTALLIGLTGRLGTWRRTLRDRMALRLHAAAGLALGANWFTYIWAVTHGRIVEASLGYFICPLVIVFLGVAILRERLDLWRGAAVACAAAGVALLTWRVGTVPAVSLTLAGTFALYSLLHKKTTSDALVGLALETGLLSLGAAAYLGWRWFHGEGAFAFGTTADRLLLLSAGPVTAVPLLWFARAAQGLRLLTLGLMQYVSPFLQLLVGVVVYGEPFGTHRLVAFLVIWVGLGLHSYGSLRRGADDASESAA